MSNWILPIILCAGSCATAQAGLYSYSYTGSAVNIPDGNLSGWSDSHTFSAIPSVIESVTVDLSISGGYNGDLYAYLSHGGALVPLLNRVGVGTGNSFGYSTSGMTLTLSDAGTLNIHGVSAPSSGGTYRPDGRAIDPLSAVSAFDAAGVVSFGSAFGPKDANGAWTLFLADVSGGGGQPVLQGWSLDITAVPEPVNVALGCFAGVFGVVSIGRSQRVRKMFGVS
jgi:hypothetical protein